MKIIPSIVNEVLVMLVDDHFSTRWQMHAVVCATIEVAEHSVCCSYDPINLLNLSSLTSEKNQS